MVSYFIILKIMNFNFHERIHDFLVLYVGLHCYAIRLTTMVTQGEMKQIFKQIIEQYSTEKQQLSITNLNMHKCEKLVSHAFFFFFTIYYDILALQIIGNGRMCGRTQAHLILKKIWKT